MGWLDHMMDGQLRSAIENCGTEFNIEAEQLLNLLEHASLDSATQETSALRKNARL
jgi:hypothetical protein